MRVAQRGSAGATATAAKTSASPRQGSSRHCHLARHSTVSRPGGSQHGCISYVSSRWAAPPPRDHDTTCYIVLALVWAVVAWKLREAIEPPEALYCQAGMASAAGALLWMCLWPASYYRHRTALGALLYLQLPLGHVVVNHSRLLSLRALAAGVLSKGSAGPLSFLLLLLVIAIIAPLLGALTFHPPPVLAAGLHLVGVLLASSANARTCASELMTHLATQPWIHALYCGLEPVIAPLEPLLLAAGVGHGHPHRHCHCVMTSLQVWVTLVLSTVVVTWGHCRRYCAWRAQQRHLQREWRVVQREQRRANSLAWNFALKEPPSSSNASNSSRGAAGFSPHGCRLGRDELEWVLVAALPPHVAQRRAAAAALASSMHFGHQPHPKDWQYSLAYRAMRRLRMGPYLCALLLALHMPLYLYHRQAFA